MKQLICKICGGTVEIESNRDFGVCDSCGRYYSIDEFREDLEENTANIEKSPDETPHLIFNSDEKINSEWYASARKAKQDGNTEMAERFYRDIAISNPFDWEGLFYSNYFLSVNQNHLNYIEGSLDRVFSSIYKSNKTVNEKWDIVNEIIEHVDTLCDSIKTKILPCTWEHAATQSPNIAGVQKKMADNLEQYFSEQSKDFRLVYLKSYVQNLLFFRRVQYEDITLTKVNSQAFHKREELKTVEKRIKILEPEYESVVQVLHDMDKLNYKANYWNPKTDKYDESKKQLQEIEGRIKKLDSQYIPVFQNYADDIRKKLQQNSNAYEAKKANTTTAQGTSSSAIKTGAIIGGIIGAILGFVICGWCLSIATSDTGLILIVGFGGPLFLGIIFGSIIGNAFDKKKKTPPTE